MDRVNTASIVESCRALPGVSVEDREDGASRFQLSTETWDSWLGKLTRP